MNIEELVNKDPSFTESSFIAKVDNTFIMILSGIMMDNMERVKHKVSYDVYKKYQEYVDKLNRKNEKQMYDELNVKSTKIDRIEERKNEYIIYVTLISRYMDYRIDKTTLKYKSGINKDRVEKINKLVFSKIKTNKKEPIIKKCMGCGANIDVNNTGKCPYCNSIYSVRDYDWILESID